eukprot:1157806-Pelagomonas_calceolata.AAC.1
MHAHAHVCYAYMNAVQLWPGPKRPSSWHKVDAVRHAVWDMLMYKIPALEPKGGGWIWCVLLQGAAENAVDMMYPLLVSFIGRALIALVYALRKKHGPDSSGLSPLGCGLPMSMAAALEYLVKVPCQAVVTRYGQTICLYNAILDGNMVAGTVMAALNVVWAPSSTPCLL